MDCKTHIEGYTQEKIKNVCLAKDSVAQGQTRRTMFQTQPRGIKTPEVVKTFGVCYFNIDNKCIISYCYSKGQQ